MPFPVHNSCVLRRLPPRADLGSRLPGTFPRIDDPVCQIVIVDLTGVRIVLSGMLGLLVSARNRGREVELLNPSSDVQEILRTTKLDTFFLIRGSVS